MASLESDHIGRVALKKVHGLTFLEHNVTGECCLVPTESKLQFIRGKAAVGSIPVSGNATVQWASDIFIFCPCT